MPWLRFLALVIAAVLVAGRASAQSSTKTGTIDADKSGSEIAQKFHDNGWNTGGFFCRIGSLIVWPESGPCLNREVRSTFTVLTGGGVTSTEHPYEYHVFCGVGNIVRHELAFDGAALTPIDSGTFTFNLTGGDTIRVVTTEGPIVNPPVPTLTEWGLIIVVILLLTSGAFVIWRRTVA
jgi:IPTL-CTERM motif